MIQPAHKTPRTSKDEETHHGGRRKGAGRPPAEDKVEHAVYFRLDSERYAAAVLLAEQSDHSVHSLAKHLLLTAIAATVEVPAKPASRPAVERDHRPDAPALRGRQPRQQNAGDHCKGCGAPIIWAMRDGSSKRLAVDVAPAAEGNVLLFHSWQLRRGFGRVPIIGARALTLSETRRARREGRDLYTSRLETCPCAQLETTASPGRRESEAR